MYILYSNIFDPYFNIAAEEYLLKNSYDDVFFIYRNEPSIIVGKHQNAIKEINLHYVKSSDIKVVRRISGGGTVYHDLGNVNFTFITSSDEGKQVDFERYTSPILQVLSTLNIPAVFSGKSDLTIDGKKISGNAAHVFKTKALHHGTLLFNSQLDKLNEALKVNLDKFSDKAVASRRSEVTNICGYLKQPVSIEEFMDDIITRVTIDFDTDYERSFNQGEIRRIGDLVKDKYGTWDWNFGYSPKYSYTTSFMSKQISLDVVKGRIENVHSPDDESSNRELEELKKTLINVPHSPAEIKNKLQENIKSLTITGFDIDKFVEQLF